MVNFSPDTIAAILNRVDTLFDLEATLTPEPGMLQRTADPACNDRISATKITATRHYAVSYQSISASAHRGENTATQDPLERLRLFPPELSKPVEFRYNQQRISARITVLQPIENITASATGVAVLKAIITWELTFE